MSIVLGGRTHELEGIEAVSFLEHGLDWPVGQNGVKPRVGIPDLGVVHCTAGVSGGQRFFQNITARGHSVEFHIDALGRVWQFLDPLVHAAQHVGGLNARAVGIEVQNLMYPIDDPREKKRPKSFGIVQVVGATPGPHPNDFKVKNGVRSYYRRSGRKQCLGLWPGQLIALRALVKALERAGIPPRLADARDYIPNAERHALRGWVGHVQVTLGHGDPSLDWLSIF